MLERLAARHGGSVRWLARGDHLLVAGHRVAVLWPDRGAVASNLNNLSLVLSMDLGAGHRLLLMGDSELPVERGLLATLAKHDMMLMPHHGSRTSSSVALLDRLQPTIAIAQTGFHNRYGFPDPGVIGRYLARHVQVVNTASGAVELVVDSARVRLTQWHDDVPEKRRLLVHWLAYWLALIGGVNGN